MSIDGHASIDNALGIDHGHSMWFVVGGRIGRHWCGWRRCHLRYLFIDCTREREMWCCHFLPIYLLFSCAFACFLFEYITFTRGQPSPLEKRESKDISHRQQSLRISSYLIADHSTHFSEWNAWVVLDQTLSRFAGKDQIATGRARGWPTSIVPLECVTCPKRIGSGRMPYSAMIVSSVD